MYVSSLDIYLYLLLKAFSGMPNKQASDLSFRATSVALFALNYWIREFLLDEISK